MNDVAYDSKIVSNLSVRASGANRTPTRDPRAVANLILDNADQKGRRLTNLVLQKLLYFAHGTYLIENKEPFVSGYFEAWQYGPVHPTVYDAFKEAVNQPITFRAKQRDLFTDQYADIPEINDSKALKTIERVVAFGINLSAARLVQISHSKGGPWEHIVDRASHSVVIGMRITNEVIVDRFKHHKALVSAEAPRGEVDEEDEQFD